MSSKLDVCFKSQAVPPCTCIWHTKIKENLNHPSLPPSLRSQIYKSRENSVISSSLTHCSFKIYLTLSISLIKLLISSSTRWFFSKILFLKYEAVFQCGYFCLLKWSSWKLCLFTMQSFLQKPPLHQEPQHF